MTRSRSSDSTGGSQASVGGVGSTAGGGGGGDGGGAVAFGLDGVEVVQKPRAGFVTFFLPMVVEVEVVGEVTEEF